MKNPVTRAACLTPSLMYIKYRDGTGPISENDTEFRDRFSVHIEKSGNPARYMMLPPIMSMPPPDRASPVQYRRVVNEWRRRYTKAKNRADTIRAKSQRRWGNFETYPDSMLSDRFDADDDFLAAPKRHRVPAESSATRIDRLLRKAMERHSEGRRTAPQSTQAADRNRSNASLEERLQRLAADTRSAAASAGSIPVRRSHDVGQPTKHAVRTPPERKKFEDVRQQKTSQPQSHKKFGSEDRNQDVEKVIQDDIRKRREECRRTTAARNVKGEDDPPRHVRKESLNQYSESKERDDYCRMEEDELDKVQEKARKELEAVAAVEAEIRARVKEGEWIDTSSLSKMERFFYEEEIRLRKKEERDKKRLMKQDRGPDDAIQSAKKIWEKMQKEVNSQWRHYRPQQEQQQQQLRQDRTSQAYMTVNTQGEAVPYATWPVRQLKDKLRELGVKNHEMQCMERGELVDLLTRKAEETRTVQENEEREQRERDNADRLRSQIIEEVEEWKKNRSLRWLLNSVNRAVPGQSCYLSANATADEITKSYKRTLLKIHPDKHIHSKPAVRFRAEETFKAVNEAFNRFRTQHDRRL